MKTGTKRYSVVVIFNRNGSRVLLQKKDRTAFAGKLNGVGGKIDEDENPAQGALREIREESSIRPQDLRRFEWLGTLSLPEQCDLKNLDKYPELWFFGGVINDESIAVKPETETEEIDWYELDGNKPVTDLGMAGDGDLEYFIGRAKHILFEN